MISSASPVKMLVCAQTIQNKRYHNHYIYTHLFIVT